jgi:flagellar motor switch protein FliG
LGLLPMSTLRQAAVLLANLPTDDAAELLSKLDPAEQQVVRAEMTRVDGNGDLQAAASAFARENHSAPPVTQRSLSELLQRIENQTLLAALADEHPQTIALVVANLPRPRAIRVLATIPGDLQANIVRRIAGSGSVDPQIVQDVTAALRQRLSTKERTIENRAA